MTLGWLSF